MGAILVLQNQGSIDFNYINISLHVLVHLFFCSLSYNPSSFSIRSFVLRRKSLSLVHFYQVCFLSWWEKIILLSSHYPISASGLDKLTVYLSIFGQNATTVTKATSSSLVSLDLSLVWLAVKHRTLPNGGHWDKLKQLFYIILYWLQETIKFFSSYHSKHIAQGVGNVKVGLPYGIRLTHIFKYFKVPLTTKLHKLQTFWWTHLREDAQRNRTIYLP